MPLALLLQKQVAVLEKGAKKLGPWTELVYLEELLIDRARSAFLVHWFGSRLPLSGLNLRVAIENLDDLRARYLEVTRSVQPPPSGLNLTEPLAGLVGTLFGSLSAPINSMFLYAAVARLIPRWWMAVFAGLNWICWGLLGVILAPMAGIAAFMALPIALSSDIVRAIYELLGALAEMAAPLRRLWEQLTGPRERVRNPILLEMLEIGDRLAVLLPFAFALLAFMVIHIGAFLRPLAILLEHLPPLIMEMGRMLRFIVEDLLTTLLEAFTGDPSPFTPVKTAFRGFRNFVPVLREGFVGLYGEIMNELRPHGEEAVAVIRAWFRGVRESLETALAEHIVIRTLRDFTHNMRVIIRVFRESGSSEPPGILSRLLGGIVERLPPAPPFPSLPSLPSPGEVAAQAEPPPLPITLTAIRDLADLVGGERELTPGGVLPEPFALSEAAQRGMRRIRRPQSLLAAERRAVEAEFEPRSGVALSELRRHEFYYRNLLSEIVRRILPERAAERVLELEGVFRTLDEALDQAEPSERPLPVRALTEQDRLQPIVQRLHIRVPGAEESAVRAWGEALQRALNAETYLTPAGM